MAINDLLRVEDDFRAVKQLAAARRKVETELKYARDAQVLAGQKVRSLQEQIAGIDVEIQASADRIKPAINKEAAVV